MSKYILRLVFIPLLSHTIGSICMDQIEPGLFEEREFIVPHEGASNGSAAHAMPEFNFDYKINTHSAIVQLPALPNKILQIIQQNASQEIIKMIKAFKTGEKICAIFYGQPGTGKTSLAYALAKVIGVAGFIHIQASSLITPFQGSGEQVLNRDIGGIIELAKIYSDNKYLVLIDELEQVYGYGTERKAPNLMLHLKFLFEASPNNIMYIGTTNRYGELDDSLLTHKKHIIEIPYPSRDYRKAIVKALLPEETDAVYQRDASLNEEFLDQFADSIEGISIREITGLFSRAKGFALMRQSPHETLEDIYKQTLAEERARTQIGAISDDMETGPADLVLEPKERAMLMGQDLLKGLAEYKSELHIKEASTSRWGEYFSWVERALPFINFFTQQVTSAMAANEQQRQFGISQRQASLSHALGVAQMKQNAFQFAASQALQKTLSERAYSQQQQQFEWTKKFQQEQSAVQAWQGSVGLALNGVSAASSAVSTVVKVHTHWDSITKPIQGRCTVQ